MMLLVRHPGNPMRTTWQGPTTIILCPSLTTFGSCNNFHHLSTSKSALGHCWTSVQATLKAPDQRVCPHLLCDPRVAKQTAGSDDYRVVHGNRKVLVLLLGLFVVVVVAGGGGGLLFTLGLPNLTG